jgi:hypothetical protein
MSNKTTNVILKGASALISFTGFSVPWPKESPVPKWLRIGIDASLLLTGISDLVSIRDILKRDE